MIKKMTQAVLMLAGILLACVPMSHATIGLSVSSTTNHVGNNLQVQPIVFLARRGESITYTLTSTAPLNPGCTVNFELSTNMSNWQIIATTATGTGGFGPGLNVALPPQQADTFYRWNIISTVTSGSPMVPFTVTIKDNDDAINTFKNGKQQDSILFSDDSLSVFGAVKPDRVQFQTSNGFSQISSTDGIVIASSTQFGWGQMVPYNKTYGLAVSFATNTVQLDKSFAVIRATGVATQTGDGTNGILLSARPTISTETAVNGDRLTFISRTSSITFQDNGTLAGSGLRLGATVRAVGFGDILDLIFFNGFWYEFGFLNNLE